MQISREGQRTQMIVVKKGADYKLFFRSYRVGTKTAIADDLNTRSEKNSATRTFSMTSWLGPLGVRAQR
jgi:hypothetical protein